MMEEQQAQSPEVAKLVQQLIGKRPMAKKSSKVPSHKQEEQEAPEEDEMVLATEVPKPRVNSKRLQEAWEAQMKEQKEHKVIQQANRKKFLEELKKKREEKQANAVKVMHMQPTKMVEIGTKGEVQDPIQIEDSD